jgi:hypothetical protein
MPSEWCPICCTRHRKKVECPGQLLATGAERYGWRISVDTPRGIEACGVLIAEAGGLWRARVMTYPNVLWTIPGGQAALKFAADSPQRAERMAIAFIKEHYRSLGYRMRDDTSRIEPQIIDLEAAEPAFVRPDGQPASRKIRFLPVRYGISQITERGGTGNLSETGLFVITNSPESEGIWLNVKLDLKGAVVNMKGLVRWMNSQPHAGRSPGMGIQLEAPPTLYTRYVRLLA